MLEICLTKKRNILVAGVYLNPGDDIRTQCGPGSILKKLTRASLNERKKLFCLGDFNAKCTLNGEAQDNHRGEVLCEFADRNNLFFTHDGDITFRRTQRMGNGDVRIINSRIDFALSTDPTLIQDYRTGPELFFTKDPNRTLSDLRPISFEIGRREKPKAIRKAAKKINWKRFDWDAYKIHMQSLDWSFLEDCGSASPNEVLTKINNHIELAIRKSEPIYFTPGENIKPWWRCSELLPKLLAIRNHAKRRFDKYPNGPNKLELKTTTKAAPR